MADSENKAEPVTDESTGPEATSEEPSSQGDTQPAELASQLMQNPQVLAALQDRLGSIVGGSSGYIQSLPKVVKRRIKALKKLQFEATKIEADFYHEVHKLECEFAKKYAPYVEKRKTIVMGAYEPTEDESDWPSDDEKEDELAEEVKNKANIEEKAEDAEMKEEKDEDSKGIPGFWLTIFKNVDMLSEMIQPQDEAILNHLQDVRVDFKEKDPMGFTLEFIFETNEFFENKSLTKEYVMRAEPEEADPFSFEGPEIVKCNGCKIDWKKGKNVTVKTIKKKQKHKASGTTRTISKTVQSDSFFNFFSPPTPPEEEEMDEETEALLAADFEIGHFIRERIVPRAVLYFTGEALENDDEYEDGEEEEGAEEGEYDEDGDPDYNPQHAVYLTEAFQHRCASLALGMRSAPSSAPCDTRLFLRPKSSNSQRVNISIQTDITSRPSSAPTNSPHKSVTVPETSFKPVPHLQNDAFCKEDDNDNLSNIEPMSLSSNVVEDSRIEETMGMQVNLIDSQESTDSSKLTLDSSGKPGSPAVKLPLKQVKIDSLVAEGKEMNLPKVDTLVRQGTEITLPNAVQPQKIPDPVPGTSGIQSALSRESTFIQPERKIKPQLKLRVPKLKVSASGSRLQPVTERSLIEDEDTSKKSSSQSQNTIRAQTTSKTPSGSDTKQSNGGIVDTKFKRSPIQRRIPRRDNGTVKDVASSIVDKLCGKGRTHQPGQVPNVGARPSRKYKFDNRSKALRSGVSDEASSVTDHDDRRSRQAASAPARRPEKHLGHGNVRGENNNQSQDTEGLRKSKSATFRADDRFEKKSSHARGRNENLNESKLLKAGQSNSRGQGPEEECEAEGQSKVSRAGSSVSRQGRVRSGCSNSGQKPEHTGNVGIDGKSGSVKFVKNDHDERAVEEGREISRNKRNLSSSLHAHPNDLKYQRRGVRIQNGMIATSFDVSDSDIQDQDESPKELSSFHPKLRNSPYLINNPLLMSGRRRRKPSARSSGGFVGTSGADEAGGSQCK